MAQVSEEKLLEAIQKDDIKAFNTFMENAQCGAYRLGRFPVLSLLYLYNSKKILAAFEDNFIKTALWEELKEPASIALAFSEKAGKCLRLYLNEIVSPLEMLLILDQTKKLKRIYPLVKPSNAVKERLQSIYSVKHSLKIEYKDNDIIIDRRPLSRSEKKRIATVCLCSFLAVAVAIAAPVTTISLIPKRVEGEVTKLSHIDFTKKTTYTLKKDITIPASYADKEMNCTIVGEGHKLIFEKGATLGKFGGKIKDVEIVTSGSPLFSTISEKGEISGATVNVTADIQTNKSSAFIAVVNSGTISDVVVNVSGSVSATFGDSEVVFGGIVVNNYITSQTVYGTISNCTVNYSDFSLVGELMANGVFGGIAGVNSGAVEGCTVKGKVYGDTFDMAGVCAENYGLLSGNINEADLSQTSSDNSWSPIVGGIAYSNTGIVRNCENRGSLTAQSTGVGEEGTLTVSVSGIVVSNYIQYITFFGYSYECGEIEGCINSGKISAEGKETVVVGGIVAHTGTPISYCLSSGDISAKGKTAFVGGIAARCEVLFDYYWGIVYCDIVSYCISEVDFDITVEDTSCVGGIVGFVSEGVSGDDYYGGGVQNCIYLGESMSEAEYSGAIVGVCGADIYNQNSYISGNSEYHNFENNYFIGSSSFGAVVNDAEEFMTVEGKGATLIDGNVEDLELYKEILQKLGK